MSNSGSELERWINEGILDNDLASNSEVWEINFDEDRQLVLRNFGLYQSLYLRPPNFVKHFYHTLYLLAVEDWKICEQIQLYDEFCVIDIQLKIRFQATLEYAQKHVEILSDLNEYIKNTYHKSVKDKINRQLLNLQEGEWIHSGLGGIEKAIATAVNEMLMIADIDVQACCSIQASFVEFPDVQLGKEAVYLSVLKKSYEVSEEQRGENFHQQQQQQRQLLVHHHKQLESVKQEAELDRQKQAQSAAHQRQLLLDQQQQQQAQFVIESQLHEEKTQHENYLNDITLNVQLQAKQEQEKRIRNAELKSQAEDLSHQALLKDGRMQADIEKHEQVQDRWLEAKDNARTLKLEREIQQKKLKFEMGTAYKKQEVPLQRELEKENSNIYLRRKIDLLEQDKKHLELQLEAKESHKANEQNI